MAKQPTKSSRSKSRAPAVAKRTTSKAASASAAVAPASKTATKTSKSSTTSRRTPAAGRAPKSKAASASGTVAPAPPATKSSKSSKSRRVPAPTTSKAAPASSASRVAAAAPTPPASATKARRTKSKAAPASAAESPDGFWVPKSDSEPYASELAEEEDENSDEEGEYDDEEEQKDNEEDDEEDLESDAPLHESIPAAVTAVDEGQSDDDAPLCNFAEVEVANIPVLKSIREIAKQADCKRLLRVYFDLKVAYHEVGMSLTDDAHVIHVYCVAVNRSETLETLGALDGIMKSSSEKKEAVLKKMVRISIWSTTLKEVKTKMPLLSIIRVLKFSSLHTFNGTPQFNARLRNIQVSSQH